MFHNSLCWLWGPRCIGERYLLCCFCPYWCLTTPIERARTMLALPLVKTRWGIPQRDISNVPTSVASSGKLKQQKLQNTIQNTHTKIKAVSIKTNSQNTHKKTTNKNADLKVWVTYWLGLQPKQKTKIGKRLEYDNSHRLGLHKTPKTNKTQKIIKDLNRTIRPGLGQKTK